MPVSGRCLPSCLDPRIVGISQDPPVGLVGQALPVLTSKSPQFRPDARSLPEGDMGIEYCRLSDQWMLRLNHLVVKLRSQRHRLRYYRYVSEGVRLLDLLTPALHP